MKISFILLLSLTQVVSHAYGEDELPKSACVSIDHFIQYNSDQSKTKFTCDPADAENRLMGSRSANVKMGSGPISLRAMSWLTLECTKKNRKTAEYNYSEESVVMKASESCRYIEVCHIPTDPKKKESEQACYRYFYNEMLTPFLASPDYCFGGYMGSNPQGSMTPEDIAQGTTRPIKGGLLVPPVDALGLKEDALVQQSWSDYQLACLEHDPTDKEGKKALKGLIKKFGNCEGVAKNFWAQVKKKFETGCAEYSLAKSVDALNGGVKSGRAPANLVDKPMSTDSTGKAPIPLTAPLPDKSEPAATGAAHKASD
jgi:hypothetical protein